MSLTITIASNATVAKLHEPSREVKLAVQDILSYAVGGAEHSIAFKRGNWDGRSSFLDFKLGTFPAGFVHYVSAKLRQQGYQIRHVRKPLPEPQGPELPEIDSFGYDPRYDYQPEVVKRLRKHGQIIAQVATGGGKSRIARMAFASINLPTLFLTTRGILMYQMKDAFEEMGTPVSVLGDGQFGHTTADGRQAVKKMCVGMVQTLIARLEEKTVDGELEKMMDARVKKELKDYKAYETQLLALGGPLAARKEKLKVFEAAQTAERKKLAESMRADAAVKVSAHMRDRARTIALLERFGLVILEEAHEASGNSYYEILRHCKNAHYRLALTATPFMKGDEESNMRLMACSGPIAIKITEQMLIDRGILAQPHFKFIPLRHKPAKLARGTGWQSAYRLGIVDNEHRNEIIVAECKRMADHGLTSMVLIQQTRHGEVLEAAMREVGLRVDFIRGEDDQDGRKRALKKLAAGLIDVLIGTTILDVGVDVPAVGHVFLAGGGKAEVALRQRIGRGLRAKKVGPNVCYVTDFADAFNDYLVGHAKQRQEIIKGTPGFERFVYENGRDFDLPAMGFPLQERAAA
ncbi:DEAD/DEAH box helicase [Massilia sp. TN1-12]|uniref:DEAD/DEAH box helicase n=1 Tax=Massilia paldalensis TaxID=3377675 RepID=UPI00385071BE